MMIGEGLRINQRFLYAIAVQLSKETKIYNFHSDDNIISKVPIKLQQKAYLGYKSAKFHGIND